MSEGNHAFPFFVAGNGTEGSEKPSTDMKKIDRKKVYISEKLNKKLDCIGEYPLTSIEAPIGYGKTKSCMEYLKRSEQYYIWKNISGTDRNICWQQFCDAISMLDVHCAEKLKACGIPDNSAEAELCAEIIAGLHWDSPVIIVLDTMMERMSNSTQYMFEMVARKKIEHLHFVIIGRVRFRNNREELRMKHLLLVIDVFDFMLDRDDIVKYYALCGISIGRGDAERLRRKTDGWIAAIYLTMLHWDQEEGKFNVPDQIYDLFGQTLCRGYTEEQFEFLKRISPFEQFTMDQARTTRQMRDPERILDFMIDSCAFIWKVPDTNVYHINRLYRTYLLNMLEQGDYELRKKAYKNAADWFFHNKAYSKASTYYYKSGDFDSMIRAFSLDKGEHLKASDLYYMRNAYEACSEETQKKDFYSQMIYARQLAMCGRLEERDVVLSGIDGIGILSDQQEDRDLYEGEYQLLCSFLHYNDSERRDICLKNAAQKMAKTSGQVGRMSLFTFGSPSILFLYHNRAGELDRELVNYTGMRDCYYKLTDNNGRGSEYLFEAEIQFNRGNLEKADILSHKAGTVAARYQQTGTGICAYFLQTRICILKGEAEKGMKYLEKITEVAAEVDKRVYSETAELCESYIFALFNQLKYVADWVARGEFLSFGKNALYRPAEDFAGIIYARILLGRGEYSKYLGMADEQIESAERANNIVAQIYHHIYCASAYYKLSIKDLARDSLKKAIKLAVKDELVMPFVENGKILQDPFSSLKLNEEESVFANQCMKLYAKYEKNLNVLLRTGGDTALNVLTRREREISLLVAEGKTNKQIAGELNIAEITVKKCLSNIYSRLGIPNRASLIKAMIS